MNARNVSKMLGGVLVSMVAVSFAADSVDAPEGVSPGAPDRLTVITTDCPTFSWESVEGSEFYELVAYRLPEGLESLAELDLEGAWEVLYVRVPGRATAWTADLDRGLEPGGSYVWFVRAVLEEMEGDALAASEWSQGRFFSISPTPSVREVEEALELLRRHVGAQSATPPVDHRPPEASGPGAPRTIQGRPRVRPAHGSKSMMAAKTAIRGSLSDTTGEAYGVAGISSSSDGAGLGAANLGGGPDLVLDGSADGEADTVLRESGIDRPSAAPQTFRLKNSAGGGVTLQVEGAIAGSGAAITGVDAELLDGIDSPAFTTDAELAGALAVHGASADHDGRYYTEGELATSGGGGSVHWDNLSGVPPGFADGTDDGTTYTAGPGLIVDGDQIRLDPLVFSTVISNPDSTGTVGRYSSIAIGADGLGLISYYDVSNGDLKVAHCIDARCTGATLSTIDAGGDVGQYTSIAIGADGLGLISYYDVTNANLRVAHCDNLACTSAASTTLDSTGDKGQYTSVTINGVGLGLVSYYDATNANLRVAHCNNLACTSATITTVDSTGDVGQYTSIATGSDGFGLITYADVGISTVKVAHCSNVACTSTDSIEVVDYTAALSAVAVGADGLGLIAYYQGSSSRELRVAHCDDIACTDAPSTGVDGPFSYVSGYYLPTIAVAPDGTALIGCADFSNRDLRVAHCSNIACTAAKTTTVDGPHNVGEYASVAAGPDGLLGLMSYYDGTTRDLNVASLPYGL